MCSSLGTPLWFGNQKAAKAAAYIAGQRHGRERAERSRKRRQRHITVLGGWEARKAQWNERRERITRTRKGRRCVQNNSQESDTSSSNGFEKFRKAYEDGWSAYNTHMQYEHPDLTRDFAYVRTENRHGFAEGPAKHVGAEVFNVDEDQWNRSRLVVAEVPREQLKDFQVSRG